MNIPKPEYGSITNQMATANGNVEKTRHYQNGTIVGDLWRYTERYRMKSQTEIDEKMKELTLRIKTSSNMIDPTIQILGKGRLGERSYVDIVFAYTRDMLSS